MIGQLSVFSGHLQGGDLEAGGLYQSMMFGPASWGGVPGAGAVEGSDEFSELAHGKKMKTEIKT